MSDELKGFLKKHDVKLDAPPGEWNRLQSRIEESRKPWFALGRGPWSAVYAVVSLALVVFLVGTLVQKTAPLLRPNLTMTDDEAATFMADSFADWDEDENEDEFEL